MRLFFVVLFFFGVVVACFLLTKLFVATDVVLYLMKQGLSDGEESEAYYESMFGSAATELLQGRIFLFLTLVVGGTGVVVSVLELF